MVSCKADHFADIRHNILNHELRFGLKRSSKVGLVRLPRCWEGLGGSIIGSIVSTATGNQPGQNHGEGTNEEPSTNTQMAFPVHLECPKPSVLQLGCKGRGMSLVDYNRILEWLPERVDERSSLTQRSFGNSITGAKKAPPSATSAARAGKGSSPRAPAAASPRWTRLAAPAYSCK